MHSDLFLKAVTAARVPTSKCLGYRPYDPATKTFGQYEWLDYTTVQRRRANLGVGLVEINKQAGVVEQKYGVGLWCQNRPEWQLIGWSFSGEILCAR